MANKNVKFTLTAVDKTKAAFDKVTKGLKGVGSVAGKATKGVAKIGLAATAAATALAALVKVNVDFMDKLGKTASKLGIEVEFLQAMRFAAEQTGVKVEALDMGLQRFIRRAAEAAQGTGESKRAFEQLGIQLTDNNGNLRDVREILFDVADGLENTTSSAEQVRLAFKFFDSEGVSLVNTLKDGADGLREFEQQAENLGIIISRQSIAKAEMFANSINILKKQITAISANITAAFIPVLDDVSERLQTILADMKGGDDTFENFGKDLAVGILTFMRTAFIGFVEFMNGIKKQIADFSQTKIGKMIFPEMADEQAKLRSEFKKTGEELDVLNALLDRPDLWGRYKGGVFELGATLRKTENELKLIRSQIEGIDPEDNDFIKAFDAMILKVKNFKLELKDLKDEDPAGGKKMSEAVLKFKDSLGATELAIDNLTINTMKKFEDTLIEGLKNGKLAFQDFANYAIEQMLRIALQEAIIAPMTGGVESFFKGIFGKKALGGAVNAGKPYMVGESGRELFIPNQGGQIVSNQDLKGINSTQSAPTVNFNISTVDAAGFDQLLTSRKGLITQIINNAMNTQGKMGVV
jgi:TP901 family phage tail tape measure protein